MTPREITAWLDARRVAYREFFTRTLVELCAVDTTVGRDPADCAAGDAACGAVIGRLLGAALPLSAVVEKRPIDPAIARRREYTRPPGGRSFSAHFDDRYNVIATVPGEPGRGIPMIYNAHFDTVAPHIAPRVEGGRVHGRGAADDKGSIALLLTALKALGELEAETGTAPRAPRVYQFVIEEETGGNGSLAALMDRSLEGYAALVMEVTGGAVHPANRGAVWYQAELIRGAEGARLAEAAAAVILALEEEGAAIKKESAHPLFLPEHVQTCHGILGPYGAHPSAVNDHAAFTVEGLSAEAARAAADAALGEYVARYGDKTKVVDPVSGGPMVAAHYAIAEEKGALRLDVYGKAGHMGAIHRLDCALIKAAWIIEGLAAAGGRTALACGEGGRTMLEGGQGFVPTHGLEEITRRLAAAAARGAERYGARLGLSGGAARGLVDLRFEKLRNDAFAGDPESAVLACMEAAWADAGRPWTSPRGWQVSCDARLFHAFGHDVIVWGPGDLEVAHSAEESLSIDGALEALPILVLFTLRAGGAFA
ncbi:MAG TPA: M20/M25/M40 family metallo-hydrolase [Planctomycetota bacterium]|jgi:acetylornithine deacetylase/succinyl-diaminopimelate desuccinylase-like protein|nr:M20/M25/M40 family metallo-hydrolase [Planctomycetota bacterium]OQC19067.1 MAG: succinyl-diaminopimelate desuccinylase [Planctomycetes bacterium ADurb.Bin069]HNS00267.1 M20/M25/M40 family metallo-hydrolase [Planctomycetota bacterium]HNU27520.1 M20/M25/M40 family metallo-hydrolase [Planctomycetota bacterium]HOE31011.1 M20/M25/M40 family metallo-hydrolase [Planctomycetota bacterium]